MTFASISSTERQQQILQLLARQQRISVAEICEKFSVSEATARRDLEGLAEQKAIRRIHGGAISLNQAPPELPVLLRASEQAGEKARIGQAAASLIQDGETVFLGSGTTVLEVARSLVQRKSLTILTNSLPVLNVFSGLPEVTVIALGGILRSSELSFIGHITEQALAEVRADKVVIGVHAVSLENGLMNDHLPETMTDRAILTCGQEVIVVADHTKINSVSTAYLAPLSSIQKFVTDEETSPEFIAALRLQGIEVVSAGI
jgi:DeoR/GlpR family transcriptional regulator of sugar metabolism